MTSVGERIKAIRIMIGMTQKEFAEAIGISDRSLRRIEKDQLATIQSVIKVVRRISCSFGIEENFITGRHENGTRTGVFNIEAYKHILEDIIHEFEREGKYCILKYSGKNYTYSELYSFHMNIIKKLMNEKQRVVGLEEMFMTNTVENIKKRFDCNMNTLMDEYYKFLSSICADIHKLKHLLALEMERKRNG